MRVDKLVSIGKQRALIQLFWQRVFDTEPSIVDAECLRESNGLGVLVIDDRYVLGLGTVFLTDQQIDQRFIDRQNQKPGDIGKSRYYLDCITDSEGRFDPITGAGDPPDEEFTTICTGIEVRDVIKRMAQLEVERRFCLADEEIAYKEEQALSVDPQPRVISNKPGKN